MINTPHTKLQITEMLKTIGVSSIEELFDDIKQIQSSTLNIPDGKSEFEVFEHLKKLSLKNKTTLISFLGGGFYDHFIPSAVDALSGRSEFYTPYTPYQAECSQGTLQALYEYQTSICRITQMGVSNASMYDGGSALAESVMMALRITRRNNVIIDNSVNPLYRGIIKTYLSNLNCNLIEIKEHNYSLNRKKLEDLLDDDVAAVVLQNPNFFGSVDDYSDIIKKIHSQGALAIMSVYPISLGLLKTPGEMGADIVSGEGQSLGNPLNFGGPYLGFITAKREYVRKLPGRIVGAARDRNNKKGYVLTLQAREQHIKRQKATSNICTNQNLCAIRALIYLVLLGKKGFKKIAEMNFNKSNYAKKILTETDGICVKNSGATFNEFVISLPDDAEKIHNVLIKKGFLAGLPLGRFYRGMENELLICVTEKMKKEDIDNFRDTIKDVI